jgi:DNA-binding CsgD family transcriptional regulator
MELARAIVVVNEALAAADDLQTMADNLFTAIRPFVACDWIGLFNIYLHDSRINVTTNSRLPFNWDECYGHIAAIDPANRRTLATAPGHCLHFPQIYNPSEDCDRYVLDYIKHTSDTAMGMILPVATEAGAHRMALGFFREQANDVFAAESERLASAMQPMIAAYSRTLLERSCADLRAALTAGDLVTPYVLLDERWAIVDFPPRTLGFLRNIYRDDELMGLPEEIADWLRRIRAINPNPGLKDSYGEVLTKRRLGLKFRVIQLGDGRCYRLLRLIDKRSSDDFTPLEACGLTMREATLLSYLPAGFSNSQIAAAMGIKEITVKKHLRTIGEKLGASGKTEILYAAMTKLLE